MPVIDALWIHPVKSLAGISVRSAILEDRGLRHDRSFAVIDSEGCALTQREHPPMAIVRTAIEEGEIVLSAPGNGSIAIALEIEGPEREVEVWEDRCTAIDAGDRAADWLTDVLRRPVRLVRMPRTTRRAVDARFDRGGDVVSFADGFALLLITDASLAALGAELARPADARRFRPNIVVGGVDEPFAEDRWIELGVGSMRLAVVKPCARCSIVDVDPDTGRRGTDVLAALARTRRDGSRVFFGQNLLHEGSGALSVGDPVLVLSSRPR